MVQSYEDKEDFSVLESLQNALFVDRSLKIHEEATDSTEIVFSAVFNQIVRKPIDHSLPNVHIVEDQGFDIDLDPYFARALEIYKT